MPAILLLQIAAKAVIVLALTWLTASLLRRGSASARHLVWTIGLAATLALPVVRVVGPTWNVSVPDSALSVVAAPAAGVLIPAPVPMPATPATPGGAVTSEPVLDSLGSTAPQPIASAPAALARSPWDVAIGIWDLALGLWAFGAAVLLARLSYGLFRARQIAAHATEVTDEGWLAAFDQAAALLQVEGRVALRQTSESTVPVACGLWRSSILLPADALTWSRERRLVVLLHELAHVRRRDCLVQTMAQITRALHWMNPLAHLALARLRAEQERACDDLVLAAGTDAPVYADHLFEIARSFRAPAAPAWATLAMARPSQLEGRLMAILDNQLNRAPLARRARVAVATLATTALVALGALQLSAAPREQRDPKGVRIDSTNPTSSQTATASHSATAGRGTSTQSSKHTQSTTKTDVAPNGWSSTSTSSSSSSSSNSDDGINQKRRRNPDPEPSADPDPDPEPAPAPAPRVGFLPALFTMFDAAAQQAPAAPPAPRAPAAQTPQSPQSAEVTDDTRRRVADALAGALNDENVSVRAQALNGLASMRDARAVPALLRALRDPNADLRERAIDGLAQFDTTEATDGLIGAMKDSSPDVRERAARAVGNRLGRNQTPDARFVPAFVELLKDQVPDVRAQAAAALGRLRSRDAVPALVPMLRDANKDVRERAAQSLGNIGDPAAIDPLTAALKDADADVREQAALALASIARGGRRGPFMVPPVPPVPPMPPVAPLRPRVSVDIDQQKLADMSKRAVDAASAAVAARVKAGDFNFDFAFDQLDKEFDKLGKEFDKLDKLDTRKR